MGRQGEARRPEPGSVGEAPQRASGCGLGRQASAGPPRRRPIVSSDRATAGAAKDRVPRGIGRCLSPDLEIAPARRHRPSPSVAPHPRLYALSKRAIPVINTGEKTVVARTSPRRPAGGSRRCRFPPWRRRMRISRAVVASLRAFRRHTRAALDSSPRLQRARGRPVTSSLSPRPLLRAAGIERHLGRTVRRRVALAPRQPAGPAVGHTGERVRDAVDDRGAGECHAARCSASRAAAPDAVQATGELAASDALADVAGDPRSRSRRARVPRRHVAVCGF